MAEILKVSGGGRWEGTFRCPTHLVTDDTLKIYSPARHGQAPAETRAAYQQETRSAFR